MDRVLTHLRYVRCHTCSRVFCCINHRIEHERRAHVDFDPATTLQGPLIRRRFRSVQPVAENRVEVPAAPVVPLIRRRFRSNALENRRAAVVNCRKRLHAVALGACAAQSITNGLRAQVDQCRPMETPARPILKATRRASLSTAIMDMRPVAESSPADPGPPPAIRTLDAMETTAAASTFASAVDGDSYGYSPPSIYRTPMQTPSCSNAPISPPPDEFASQDDSAAVSVTAAVFDTPTINRRGYSSTRKVSLGENSTQKGFFWTNMARRFRLALRPAKPRARASISSPAVVGTVADMAKFYGNIHPRRPIHKDDTSTPVNARPALDELRQAHEEANRALNNISTD